MNQIPRQFIESYEASRNKYVAFKLFNKVNYEVNGNNYHIDGKNICCHLLHIHNSDAVIRNLVFKRGNTSIVRHLKRNEIQFSNPKGSVFEIIDGGAVLITGNSDVVFESCIFINNNALMCGGAISNQSHGTVTVRNCIFKDNNAGHTGSAIDNLTIGSNLVIKNCKFVNNRSNNWNMWDSPHGQATIFPKTTTEINDCSFEDGSIPFDFKNESNLKLAGNIYSSYSNWSISSNTKRNKSIKYLLLVLWKLYWLPFKTGLKVYYSVTKDSINK